MAYDMVVSSWFVGSSIVTIVHESNRISWGYFQTCPMTLVLAGPSCNQTWHSQLSLMTEGLSSNWSKVAIFCYGGRVFSEGAQTNPP